MNNHIINNNNNNKDDLFLKYIWRNLIIKNQILKKLKQSHQIIKSFKYDQIISCSWMIKNKYYQLLKEKVNKGEYLIFNHFEYYPNLCDNLKSTCIIQLDDNNNNNSKLINIDRNGFILKETNKSNNYNIKNIYSIFYKYDVILKEDDEKEEEVKRINYFDYNFYKQLFKKYSNYFIENKNINQTEILLYEYDNMEALKCLVQEFNYKLDFDSFLKSFEIGSFECCFYIFNQLTSGSNGNLKKFKSNGIISKLYEITINIQNYKKVGVVKEEEDNDELFNKRIDFLINKCKFEIPTTTIKSSIIPYFYNFEIFNKPLSFLIECISTIYQLKSIYIQFFKKKLNTSKIEDAQDEIYKSIINETIIKTNLINEINDLLMTTNFNKKQMEKKICDISLSSSKFSNFDFKIISKIYKTLLPYINYKTTTTTTTSSNFINSFKFYKIFFENDTSIILNQKNQKLLKTSSGGNGGNSGEIEFNFNMFGIYNYQELKESKKIMDNRLFIYCQDKEKQKEFINLLINDLLNNHSSINDENYYKIIKLNFLIIENILTNLVWLDSIKLVIQFLNGISSDIISDNYSLIFNLKRNLLSKIKSIKMFDIIYSMDGSSGSNTISKYPLLLILIENDIPSFILQHFKNNYSNDYYSNVDKVNLKNYNYKFDLVKFIYDNIDDYSLNYDNMINIWDHGIESYSINYFLNLKLNQFIYLINKTPLNKNYSCFGKFNNQLFNWVLLNKPNDIINGRCLLRESDKIIFNYFNLKYQDEHLPLLEFFSKLNLQEYYDSKNEIFKIIYLDILENGNLELFEIILKILRIHIIYTNNYNKTKTETEYTPPPQVDPIFKNYYLKSNIFLIEKLFILIIDEISKIGKLSLFKYLELNYSDVLYSFITKDKTLIYYNSCLMGHLDYVLYLLNNSKFKTDKFIIQRQLKTNEAIPITYQNQYLFNYFKNSNNKLIKLILK